jgi:hypothetical protein
VTSAASIWLALILCGSAALKARRPAQSATALATYGIAGQRTQRVAVGALIGLELGLAAALAVALPWAAAAVGGLFAAFALCTAAALLAGRGGRPCACFGTASRLGPSAPARSAALALLAGAVAFGWLPQAPSQYDRWLTVALSVSLVAVLALAAAVLALARELGVVRLELSSSGALEIPEEGPELGMTQPWASAVPSRRAALLRLAIFTSEGCPLCRRVEPVVEHVAADPLLAVGVFDELADAATWAQADPPGSPYAVALDLNGVALAKGTFNGLAQLESIIGSARARERERGLAVAA